MAQDQDDDYEPDWEGSAEDVNPTTNLGLLREHHVPEAELAEAVLREAQALSVQRSA